MNLSDAAVTALRGAVADDRTTRLAHITDRRVFAEVDRALTRLGGRWDRRERAYMFDRDPRPQLEQLTGSRVVPPPSITRDKELSYWPTPPALAAELVAGLDLGPGARVLEPSAGDGALVAAVLAAHPGARIVAVEVDATRSRLLEHRFCTAEQRDGWTVPAGYAVKVIAPGRGMRFQDYAESRTEDQDSRHPDDRRPFDAVVMNPPFTEPGDRYAWATHLVLAWSLLRPGGQLRAIVPPSIEYGRQRAIAAARAVVVDAGGSWRAAGEGAFRASGTGVRAMVVEAVRPT